MKVTNISKIREALDSQRHDPSKGFRGYPPSFLAGFNPIEAEYEKPDSTQGKDVIPENVNKRLLPMYLPTTASDIQGNGKPVNSIELKTREQLMDNHVLAEGSGDGYNATYKHYAYTWFFVLLTIVFAFYFSVYAAALTAWLAGHNWSQAEVNMFWTKDWYMTKPLIAEA